MSSIHLRNSWWFSQNILLTQLIGITLSSPIVIWKQGLWNDQICPCQAGQQWNSSTHKSSHGIQCSLGSWTCATKIYFGMCTSVTPEHKENCKLRMESRFLSSSSLASIIIFSSWYLCCGVAEFKLQSDSLYYLFSAMIYFSTSGVSGKMCTCSCPGNKAPVPIHSLSWVIPTAEKYFCWETGAPSLLWVNSQLPKSLNIQEYLKWNFHMPRNIDFITQKTC